MIRILLCVGLLLIGGNALAEGRGLTADDLVRMKRVSAPTPSPDGSMVAFLLRETDMEANKGRTSLWVMNADGSAQRQLTGPEFNESNPVWAPDGQSLWFLSTREKITGIYRQGLDEESATAVSDLPVSVGNMKLTPDGEGLVFSMEVFLDCENLDCTADRMANKPQTTGQTYDALMMRHWDHWEDARRQHLFRAAFVNGGLGDPVDLMGSMDADSPTIPWGGAADYDFAPGGGIVFSAKNDGPANAWSTNYDLWYVEAPGVAPRNLTGDNPAWDATPVFSPDGKTIYWLAMSVPVYEADRYRIMRADWNDGQPGEPKEVAPDWDRSPGSLSISADGNSLLVHANDVGHRGVFAIDPGNGVVRPLMVDGAAGSEVESQGRVFFTRSAFDAPADIWSVGLADADAERLTDLNADRLAEIEMGAAEQFSFEGANGDTVHGWIVRPAGFDPDQSWPVAFLIHGGPQGSFNSNFHYRWNPQTYAGAGWASVIIDFHGSTGYGQEFCDSIRGNWGGWPLEDLQKGLAAALESNPWMDGDRVSALGASYGGYMINWIAGNWNDRFTSLVNHDGLFDVEFMYYATEELFFVEREYHGTPWEGHESWEKWNPANHVDKWQTPMLVIHGELDYRVPITQGLATFTALQRQGVPSRFLYYPDENHWVLKPHNSVQWHDEVLDWMNKWDEAAMESRQGR